MSVTHAQGDPMANLTLIRSMFFAAPGQSLGTAMTVHSQALEFDPTRPADAKFVENVWFEMNAVLFVTINVPGGSNNDNDIWSGTPAMSAAQAQEIAERTAADLRWIDTAFARARANNDMTVVIQTQADMWDQDGANKAHLTQYKQFIDRVASNTAAFGKPVLMLNGDSHNFRSDNPLAPGAACVVESPATGTVGAPLVPAKAAVPGSDARALRACEKDFPRLDDHAMGQRGLREGTGVEVLGKTNPQ